MCLWPSVFVFQYFSLLSHLCCNSAIVFFKVPEGHHPRGTTLREALRGNLPLRGLRGGLSEGSAGSLRGFCGVSAGFCGGPRDFPRFFGGSDPVLVTLGNCWSFAFSPSVSLTSSSLKATQRARLPASFDFGLSWCFVLGLPCAKEISKAHVPKASEDVK